ncbi:unnamed protein product [Gulo gulo]|uniref:Uncharacterized protein n=1 Tax=Gulo gulo TaxID=48420 RepID=A0A9X9PU52_GULGU|nr:unnamed protein product [Gulo gulo]
MATLDPMWETPGVSTKRIHFMYLYVRRLPWNMVFWAAKFLNCVRRIPAFCHCGT